jgi:hypothetical protein
MKKTIFKTSIVMFIALIAMSCSKDGATGPAGPAGANGTNGIDGNANVIGTNTVTISSWTSYASGSLWVGGLSATGITQSIVDKGIVSVFIQNTAGTWTALPYTIGNTSWFYDFGVGFVNINKTNTNLSAIANPGSQTFRVVIISASNKMANPNTDWKDYNQVKEALHLQD